MKKISKQIEEKFAKTIDDLFGFGEVSIEIRSKLQVGMTNRTFVEINIRQGIKEELINGNNYIDR